MLLLLDENLPKRLKVDFIGHKVFTTKECGWSGLKNGKLLEKLIENKFDAIITFDKNLRHQQNFRKYPIAVIVLNARINKYSVLTKLSPKILEILNKPLLPGPIEVS
ncbi:MAG: DUF5615 family PIN-like protein [Bacteroidia bacterium]